MIEERNYKLETIIGHGSDIVSTKKAMDFMLNCEILEVRENRSRKFVETAPNDIKLISVYKDLHEEEKEALSECVDGIEVNCDSPSMLLERKSDKKHFIIQIDPIFNYWTIFAVVYD